MNLDNTFKLKIKITSGDSILYSSLFIVEDLELGRDEDWFLVNINRMPALRLVNEDDEIILKVQEEDDEDESFVSIEVCEADETEFKTIQNELMKKFDPLTEYSSKEPHKSITLNIDELKNHVKNMEAA